MGPVSNNPNQAPQTVTLNDLVVSGNPSTSPATGPYTPEQQKAIDDANQKVIDDAIAKAKTDAATKAANDFVGPVSSTNPDTKNNSLVELTAAINPNQSSYSQIGPYTSEQQTKLASAYNSLSQANKDASTSRANSATSVASAKEESLTSAKSLSAYKVSSASAVKSESLQKKIEADKSIADFRSASTSTVKSISTDHVLSISTAQSVANEHSLSAVSSLSAAKSTSISNSLSAKNSLSTAKSLSVAEAANHSKSLSDEKASSTSASISASKSLSTANLQSASAVKSTSLSTSTSAINSLKESKSLSTANSLSESKSLSVATTSSAAIERSASASSSLSARNSLSSASSLSVANSVSASKSLSDAHASSASMAKSFSTSASLSANTSLSAAKSFSISASVSAANSLKEVKSTSTANSISASKSLSVATALSTATAKSTSTINSISASKSLSEVTALSKSASVSTVKSLSTERANSLSAEKSHSLSLLQSTDAIKSASTLASLSASKSVSEVNSQSKANSVNEVKSLSAERSKSLSEVKSTSTANSISASKSISTVNSLSKSVLDINAKSASLEKANSLSASKVQSASALQSTLEAKSASTVASISAAKSVSTVNSLSKSTSLSELKSLSTEKANSLSASTSVSKAASAASANSASAVKAASASASAYASTSAAYSLAIEKQKTLDANAKANPTVANLAAKYHVAPNVINAAKLLISDPTLNVENLRGQYAHIGSIEGFPRIYEIIDALKTKDSQPTKMPTVSEMAKNYNVSENAINAALLKTTDATDAEIKAYLKQHPISANESKYLDGISRSIHSKMGTIVQNAASVAGGETTGGETTPAVVKPVEIAKTTPETTAKVTQIAQANDLAKQIVATTKNTSKPINMNDANLMAVKLVTLVPPEEVRSSSLLDYVTKALEVSPAMGAMFFGEAFVNLVKGEHVKLPIEFAMDAFMKGPEKSVVGPGGILSGIKGDGSTWEDYVPNFLLSWVYKGADLLGIDMGSGNNTGMVITVDGDKNPIGTTGLSSSTNADGATNYYDANGNTVPTYNENNQGDTFSVAAPGSIKDSSGTPIGDGASPVAVIKLPQTNQPTEKFAEFVDANKDDPAAIDQYIKDNGLETTHIAESIHSVKNNADLIAKFNAAANQGIADGTLQGGNLIGSELFPTTNAAIEALMDGLVPLSLGINLIAEVKSIINGTNYNNELANESNIYNHWSAENPITSKLLQTLGVLGYSEITGGAGPADSMKISSIWNKDLSDNGRSIAVNLSEGPITATPIDSKGNAIGETITLNQDRLGNTFLQDIGANIGKSVDDLIGSIEGTIGSIQDFFTPAETANPIYNETIQDIADLYDNPSFDYLGPLEPNSNWLFPTTIPNVTPDLSSVDFWGSTLGNSYNTDFGNWDSSNHFNASGTWNTNDLPPGWGLNDFGLLDYNVSPLNYISDNINSNANSNWSNNANNSSTHAGSNTLTNGGTSQYPGIDATTLAYLGFLNRG